MGQALEQPGLPDEPGAAEPLSEPSDQAQGAVADGGDVLEEPGPGAGRLLGAGADQALSADEDPEGPGSEAEEDMTE